MPSSGRTDHEKRPCPVSWVLRPLLVASGRAAATRPLQGRRSRTVTGAPACFSPKAPGERHVPKAEHRKFSARLRTGWLSDRRSLPAGCSPEPRVREFVAAMRFTSDDELDLQWSLSGDVDAAFGLHSALGAQLERMRTGTAGCSTSREYRDRSAAVERFERVHARLEATEAACSGAMRVLEAFYGASDVRVLPLFGPLGRVMALCAEGPASDVEADAAKARKGDPGATSRLTSLRAKAEARLDEAQRAFAATRPVRKSAV